MKKIQYYVFLTIFALLSCENDGGTSKLRLESGTIPDLNKSENSDAFLDLTKISEGDIATIVFSVDIVIGEADKTDIIGSYRTHDGNFYHSVLFENVVLPQEFNLNSEDLINRFSHLNSNTDFTVGDRLSITTRFTLKDGTVLDIIEENGKNNVGTNHLTTPIHTPIIIYPVSCPSDIGGTYLVTTTATGCCGVNPITDHEYTVNVTDNGGGSYTLSDYSGGAYDGLFCGPFSLCGDLSSGKITDICGIISGKSPDCCSDEITIEGVVNDDGTWTLNVSSGFMSGTSTWVKQ